MILVLSTEGFEESTEQVLDWLDLLGQAYLRINGEDLNGLSLELDPANPEQTWMVLDGRYIALRDITAVWYRRTGIRAFPSLQPIESLATRLHLAEHLVTEIRALKQAFYAGLEQAYWLSHPGSASPNKFQMLQQAAQLGFSIPATRIVTRASQIRKLRENWGPLIIKCLSDTRMLRNEDGIFTQYTTAPDPILEDLPETIFPTFVQECIEKDFEVRTFYLNGRCYSMAIFSQAQEQTTTDFRIYNYEKPARSIPYQLPRDLEVKVTQLMQSFQLQTGSLDFMVGKDGAHYFLEINPVGQFGMVSFPCNYQLERLIAQNLIEGSAA